MGFALPGQKEPYNIKANVLTVVSAVFLAAIVVAAVLVWTGIGDRQPTPAPVTQPPVTQPTPDSSNFEWHDVVSWESSGDDDSPPFHISARTWRVIWAAPDDPVGAGSFTVHVYNTNGIFFLDLYDTADSPGFNFDGPLHGTLGIADPGDYFLRIRTARNYQVTVQELR